MVRVRAWMGIDEPWEETRARGKASFFWRQGILRFALPVGVLMTLYTLLLEPVLFREPMVLEGARLLRLMISGLIVWPLAGWIFALILWRTNEKKARERAS